MKRIIPLFALLFSLCSLLRAQDVRYLTTDDFKRLVFDYTTDSVWSYKGELPCVIDFYATWCGPCKRFAPVMEQAAEDYCDRVIFYKVDTDKEKELAYVFGISSIPTIIFIPTGDKKPAVMKGCLPKDAFEKAIYDAFHIKKK